MRLTMNIPQSLLSLLVWANLLFHSSIAQRLRAPHSTNDEPVAVEALPSKKLSSFRLLSNSSIEETRTLASLTEINLTAPTTQPMPEISPRIIGGSLASAKEFPWFAAASGRFSCGASLIHPRILLTAAHCVGAFRSDGVHIGAFRRGSTVRGAVFRKVIREIQHPDFQETSFSNDFMLVILADPVNDRDPVTLNTNINVPADNQELTVMGFGSTLYGGSVSKNLNEVTTFAINHNTCRDIWSTNFPRDVQLCTLNRGKGACQGDSGGPLVLANTNIQVGIVSFGAECADTKPSFPAVEARVSGAIGWIADTICDVTGDCDYISNMNNRPPPTPGPVTLPPQSKTATLDIVFQYDAYPKETTWSVLSDDQPIFVGPNYEPGLYERWTSTFDEVPYGDYVFQIDDSWGDGLTTGDYFGSAELVQDGVTIAYVSGSFGLRQTVDFVIGTDPQPAIPPSQPPTMSPTLAPSSAPTQSTRIDTGTINIHFQYDGYPDETSWVIQSWPSYQILFSGPDYLPSIYQNWTTSLVDIPVGRYAMTVYDSWGDGLKTGSFFGYYRILQINDTNGDGNTRELAYGDGVFGFASTVQFEVNAL
jgi:trypsin